MRDEKTGLWQKYQGNPTGSPECADVMARSLTTRRLRWTTVAIAIERHAVDVAALQPGESNTLGCSMS
jgi:hypothetical protein